MTLSTVANQPPVAHAGPDQTVECTGATTAVVLDGTASTDPEGAALSFEWFAGDQAVGTSARLGLGLSLGSYTFTLRVTDASGVVSEDSVVVVVVDTTAPVIQCPSARTVAANRRGGGVVPNFLTGLIVSDQGSPAAALVLTQNPTNGTLVGWGETRVTITATDAAGNQSACTTSFIVADVTPPVVTFVKKSRNARAVSPGRRAGLIGTITLVTAPTDQLVITQSPVRGLCSGSAVMRSKSPWRMPRATSPVHGVVQVWTPLPLESRLRANPEVLGTAITRWCRSRFRSSPRMAAILIPSPESFALPAVIRRQAGQ
jgi:hypothetical protein